MDDNELHARMQQANKIDQAAAQGQIQITMLKLNIAKDLCRPLLSSAYDHALHGGYRNREIEGEEWKEDDDDDKEFKIDPSLAVRIAVATAEMLMIGVGLIPAPKDPDEGESTIAMP